MVSLRGLIAWCVGLAAAAIGDEDADVPWFTSVSSYHFPHLFAEDLNASTLRRVLTTSRAEYVLIDFYAPWCPHCQHFAPDFERLALTIRRFDNDVSRRLAEQASRVNTTILSATLDCVNDASTCNEWGIDSYPTLLWGKRKDWLDGERQRLRVVDANPRTAEGVAKWIEDKSGAYIHLDPSNVPRAEIQNQLLHSVSAEDGPMEAARLGIHQVPAAGMDLWDVQVAVALLLHTAIGGRLYPEDPADGQWAALTDLVKLLAARFPEAGGSTCRNSLLDLEGLLSSKRWWQSDLEFESDEDGVSYVRANMDGIEQQWRLCGTDWSEYKKGWRSCRGTWPGKRGYTCGLWQTIHALAAGAADDSAARETEVLRAALRYFFDCQDCRDHFFKIPFSSDDIRTREAAQLWWWSAHNIVNHRVKTIEDEYEDGDPAFPKMQWPSIAACPDCRRSTRAASFLQTRPGRPAAGPGGRGQPGTRHADIMATAAAEGWVLERVAAFLRRFYG